MLSESMSPTSDSREKPKKEIEIKIRFAPHAGGKDIEGLKQELEKTDVLIPEIYGWSPETQERIQNISDGKLRLDRFQSEEIKPGSNSEYIFDLSDSIYDTKIKIDLCDIPGTIEQVFGDQNKEKFSSFRLLIDNERKSKSHLQQMFGEAIQEKNYQKAIFYINEMAKNYQASLKLRNEFYTAILKHKVESGYYDNFKTKDPGRIKILLLLGQAHTDLFGMLKQEKIGKITRFFYPPTSLYVYHSLNAMTRKIIRGDKLTERELSEYLLEVLLNKLIYFDENISSFGTYNLPALNQYLASKFNKEEIKEFFESDKYNVEGLKELFLSKGIKLPEDVDETMQMMKKIGLEEKKRFGRSRFDEYI